jgi:hypothetical protein
MALETYTEEEKKELPPIIRNPNGTFAKGSHGQCAIQSNEWNWWRKGMLDCFRKCVTKEDIQEVWVMVVKKAKEGNRWAVEELLNRVYGKPEQKVNVESVEGVKWTFSFDLSKDTNIKQIENEIIDMEPVDSLKDKFILSDINV